MNERGQPGLAVLAVTSLLAACGGTTKSDRIQHVDSHVDSGTGSASHSGGTTGSGGTRTGEGGAGGTPGDGGAAGFNAAGGTRSTGGAGSGGFDGTDAGNGGFSGGGDAGIDGAGIDGSACTLPPYAPLDGFWEEVAQLSCSGGEVVPESPILELHFAGGAPVGGTFSVTWRPFETYVDYSGTYTGAGAEFGGVVLHVDSGNYIPPDVDPEGGFHRCNDELSLIGIWLGTPQFQPSALPMCGHRFKLR